MQASLMLETASRASKVDLGPLILQTELIFLIGLLL